MTFFNKKTEVMQIEMTPYGRYLYSIGKFKPHSYEFVDDDILYKASGSTEAQEDAHNRIVNETPKLKINRAFQDEAPQVQSPSLIKNKRVMAKKMDLKQPNLSSLGRSSYSSDKLPNFQVSMLRGQISGSQLYYEIPSSGGDIPIPQVDVNLNFYASLKNILRDEISQNAVSSEVADDGTFIEVRYEEPIIHLKEFNSFYEKENFEIEVFKLSDSDDEMHPLKFRKVFSNIVNGLLVDNIQASDDVLFQADEVEYFFSIDVDQEIPEELLCEAVSKLEINNQFLDEELICPDQRTDRFNIYSTRVGPEDLEDCD